MFIAASHAVLAGKAVEKLNAAPVEKIIFTDTIPLDGHARWIPKLIPASVAPLLARAIDRIHRSESVSVLFDRLARARREVDYLETRANTRDGLMAITKIEVEPRDGEGPQSGGPLREQGRVPAVLYGEGKESLSLSVSEREVAAARAAAPQGVQAHDGGQGAGDLSAGCPVGLPHRSALHVDFLRIDCRKPMHVEVELTYLGHPVGISKGGRLVKDLAAFKVECLPEAIPETIELRVTDLDLGDHLAAGALSSCPTA